MAGGMQRGGSGRSLAERAALSGASAGAAHDVLGAGPGPGPAPPPVDGAAGRAGEGRHCWVHDPPGAPGVWPGLLVEWRQTDEGWHGRVAFTVAGPAGSVLMEAWLPAVALEQR